MQKCLLDGMQNKVRVDLHSYDSEIVMLQDYSAKKTTIIYPANSTYPQGMCQVRTHPAAREASSTWSPCAAATVRAVQLDEVLFRLSNAGAGVHPVDGQLC